MIKVKRNTVISWMSILLIFAVWFLISWGVWIGRSVEFPSPFTTIHGLFKKLFGEQIYDFSIYRHTAASLARWTFAYIVAVLVGIGSGFMMGVNQTVNRLVMPLIYVLQLIPGLAWIPIALLIFGLGNVSTIFMIFILAVTPIIITTSSGIRETSKDLIDAAVIMGANKKDLFIHVLFPSALFQIVDGMRIGLANSWRVLIAAEMIVGDGIGLGYIIIQSRWSLDYTSAFISILIIVIIGLTTEKLVFKKIEDRLRVKYGQNFQQNQLSLE
jgi:ABC-type nitrate/sulfonate/bicarbonate transport system permease component